MATVEAYADFESARSRLMLLVPQLLITNIRLGEFNGLQLVLLAAPPTRSIVYMEPEDAVLLREAQRFGAFVESPRRLSLALPSYIGAKLGKRDRRVPGRRDRRSVDRGGRRSADSHFPA